ncbi:HAD-like protein [Coniophora puteana RWD-64-598 SS2]|uniref:HAD-like protein n=1 Tax=Coniophora puteana (strain RWD-64-598) TaxID=741705 RepID=A0A5M3M7T1_CONPW|nr:HAD-like protein [Coniophora puteana RWD-64-598 SS2]EIW75332.1 HAD-like protein [Coniophora puteana RWD-64-598 SS2]
MAKVKYILFDCDNTLVQSESRAFEACSDLVNEVIAKYKPNPTTSLQPNARPIPDEPLTPAILHERYLGKNFRNMLVSLRQEYGLTPSDSDIDAYVDLEVARVIEKLNKRCEPCPCVEAALTWARTQGYPMAVVSTSAKPRVLASLEKAGLMPFFDEEHVFSAATSLTPPSSKPDPAIYDHACKQLGVRPEECVAVEDSNSGATAAKRAGNGRGIPLIGYVGIYQAEAGDEVEKGRIKMEEMGEGLVEGSGNAVVMEDWSSFQVCLAEIESRM